MDVPQRSKRWVMLAVLLAVQTSDNMIRFAMAPLGPFIMADLGIGRAALGALSSALRLSGILVAIASGRIVDRIGVRWSLFVMAVLAPAALSLFLLPLTYNVVFGLFLVVGLTLSFTSPLSNAGIMRWFGPSDRGTAFGLKHMGAPLGSALAAILLTPIALGYGWPMALVLLGLFVGPVVAFAGATYNDPPKEGDPFSGPDPTARRQPTNDAPARPTAIQQFRRPGMPWLILMGLTFAAVQINFLTFLIPFLIDGGIGLITAAAYLSVSQFAAMAGRPLVGVVSDRWMGGRRKEILLAIAAVNIASVFLMSTFAIAFGPVALASIVAVAGASSMAWGGIFFAAVLERADPRGLGSASGLGSTANMSGGLVGAPLFGLISDVAGFRVAFWVFAAVLGIVATFFARNFVE